MPYSENGQLCILKIVIVTTRLIKKGQGTAILVAILVENPYLNLSKILIKVMQTWNLKAIK